MGSLSNPGQIVRVGSRSFCPPARFMKSTLCLVLTWAALVLGAGALPGAAALIAELAHRGMPYAIVTNDASRSAAHAAAALVAR